MFGLFKKKNVITRIAPSPTGVMHVGTARTALFNYLFAKKHGGKFICRIEDTDVERSKKEYEDNILESMEWLGIKYDSFYRQSDRKDIYKKYTEKLINSGHAYVSKEATGERESVIRFKNPNTIISFKDLIRGEIKFDTTELGDFVIAKTYDEPLYHLAVVIDDHEMGITHIIRGEDGISNTPRQILIQGAIGAKMPLYAHLPLILGQDKSKLSKRHGAVSIAEYKKDGYLREAIINHLAMLGWNPGTDQEIFDMDTLIKQFDIEKISKGGAVFNIEKLNWFNKEHLKRMSEKDFVEEFKNRQELANVGGLKFNDELIIKLRPILLERINKLGDIDKLFTERELDYYIAEPSYDPRKLLWKDTQINLTTEYLKESAKQIESLTDYPTPEQTKNAIWKFAEEKGRGQVLWPLRYSLSGKDKSPDPFVLISILGKTESLKRIDSAIKKLNAISDK